MALIVILLLVVGVHELGHYWAARLVGVKTRRIVLGLGQPFCIKKFNSGLELAISPWPIGGYVKFFDEREISLTLEQQPYSFTKQSAWRRLFIYLGGPCLNIIFAGFIFSSLYYIGFTSVPPVIGAVEKNSIADKAGLRSGELLLTIDGWQTSNWSLALLAIVGHSGNQSAIRIKVKTLDNNIRLINLDVDKWHFNGIKQTPLGSLGLSIPKKPNKIKVSVSLSGSIKHGIYKTWQYLALNCLASSKILTGKISIAALSGPLKLLKTSQILLRTSIEAFLNFIALFSIAVGVVNLLPLPTLDGGHILYIIIEKLRGQAVSVAMQVLMYRFMMVAIFIICMQLLANDLIRLDSI